MGMESLLFTILNLICGILIVIMAWDANVCSWFRILFGVAIAWVAITEQICDRLALVWFPLWNRSFLFMGGSYIFLACGGFWWLSSGAQGWTGFSYFVVWAVGVAYVIIGICELVGCCGCARPSPLLGGGGGGGGSAQPKEEKADAPATTAS